MADWYQTVLKGRAKKLITQAQQEGLDYTTFLKQAARTGVSGDVDVQNYAAILQQEQKRAQQTGRQSAITSAVGRSLEPQPVLQGQDLMNRAEAASSMAPEEYFAASQQPNVPEPTATAPIKTREELYGALGRQQLPADTTFEDVEANPQFQFAQGQFPGADDELARARLKLAQEKEAGIERRAKEANKLGEVRNRLKGRDLDLQQYNRGVKTLEGGLRVAADAEKDLQETIKDEGALTAKQKMLTKIISSKSDEDGRLLNADEIDAANAQLAELSVLLVTAKAQRQAYMKEVARLKDDAYTRGSQVSKQSPKVFEQPKDNASAAPAPAPAPGGNLPETIAKKYNIE